MKKAFLPILIIATGSGWLLSSKNVVPGVDWAWVLLMASLGVIVLLNKLNKMTIVLGPMLLIASVLFVMLQTEKIAIDMLFPVLVISFGVLMLIARTSKLPDAFKEEDSPTESEDHK
ncbi:MAG: hypothetical protein NE328_13190 [Lentisphaeraceae bacterium]|nr:hypothetical protein [Lentisphaeraceae bacterium]